MAKKLIFIDWDDTLTNRENAENFELVKDENDNVYQMSPMFAGAIDALKQLQEKYHVVLLSSRGELNRLRQLQLKSYGIDSSVLPLDNFVFAEEDSRLLFSRYGETNFPDKASFILYIQKMSGNTTKIFIDDDHTEIAIAKTQNIPTLQATHKNELNLSEQFFTGLIHRIDNIDLYRIFNELAAEVRSHSRSIHFGSKVASLFSHHLPTAMSLEVCAAELQKKPAQEISDLFNQYLTKIAYNPQHPGDITASLVKAKTALENHLSVGILSQSPGKSVRSS